jgi:hypothetical protein
MPTPSPLIDDSVGGTYNDGEFWTAGCVNPRPAVSYDEKQEFSTSPEI